MCERPGGSLLGTGWSKRPETDEQKQVDPFALCADCGAVFRFDVGDDYLSLCLRTRPDHTTVIREVLARSPAGPSFAFIDAIAGGVRWPKLPATLGGESGRETLAVLLAPNTIQTKARDPDTIQIMKDFMA